MNNWIKKHGLRVRPSTEAEREYARETYGIIDCNAVAHDANGVTGYGSDRKDACEHYCYISGERPWNCPQYDLGEG